VRLILCASVASFCLAAAVLADDTHATEMTFSEIAARLAAPAVLRGKFQQTREIELLSKPLQSNGYFLLSGMGLYWHQEAPVASVMIADSERLLQRVGDGPLQSIDVEKNPVVLTFSQSFLSIFEGDEAELRKHFEVSFEPGDQPDNWQISLTPVSFPMSEAIESIILNGREYIEELKVISRSSERTIISFSDLQTEPTELTEHEIELYAR
jgi:hypothetical protein